MPRLAARPSPCQRAVDRLGWTTGATFACQGVRVGLRATRTEDLELLASWLPRAMKPAPVGVVRGLYSFIRGGPGPSEKIKKFHILYRDATRLARSLDIEVVRRAFNRDINIFIGENARRGIFVHAGVVAIGNGAILLPGRSFSGKTTLTRALVEQGAVYYSDEYAVLDSRGRVAPWAEPLSIRESGSNAPARRHSLHSLGIVAGVRPLSVRLVVLTSFEKGRRFKPGEASRAAGALGLLEHTLPARRRPRSVLRALSLAMARARVVNGPRGEATEAARAIMRLIETAPE